MKGVLSDVGVSRLKPRGRMYEVTCSRLAGFVVRVLPTGRKVFLVRYQVDGRDKRVRLGLFSDALTADEARRQAMAILSGEVDVAQLEEERRRATASEAKSKSARRTPRGRKDRARAIEQVGPVPSHAPGATVREMCERYDREFIAIYLKPRTAENYRRIIRDRLLPSFGDRPFESLSRRDGKALHGLLAAQPALADYAVCVLGSLYTRIINDWELSDMKNPAAGIKRFGSRKVERFLSPAERRAVHAVLEAGQAIPRGRKGRIEPFSVWAIKLLMLTGLRRNEVVSLKWPMVDWQHGCLHLPDTKTGQRSVVVSGAVIKLLREIHEATGERKEGLVIRGLRGTKLSSLNVTWDQVRKEAGIPDVRLHDLRHSFASDALMAGVPLAIVGEMLGHKNPTTTQRYAHLADGVVRDALELATRRIMDATEEGPVVAKEVRFSPLTDAQWRRVAPLVDGSRPRTGRHVDLRDIVDGVRWVQERGARWREVPERFGAPTTCWRWYKRWVESGVWDRMLGVLG